jgi:hypothetical protein
MSDYLLVECIITNLTQAGVIFSPGESWKNVAVGTKYYFADFSKSGTGSILSFRVSVIDGNHVISVTSFINQARFLNINPEPILNNCRM